MGDFKFILSKEKFAEIDIHDTDDTLFHAKQLSTGDYEISFLGKDGLETSNFYKGEVEVNVKDGFWVKVSDLIV